MDKSNNRDRLKATIENIASALGVLYLVAFVLGFIGTNRLGTTELVMFGVLMLFTSGIIDRIRKLGISKGGINVEMDEIKKSQEKLSASQDVIRLLLSQPEARGPEEARQEIARGLPPLDRVITWAREKGASNPYNMGPKNWQRCLWDLGFGGQAYDLRYDSDGKLIYQ